MRLVLSTRLTWKFFLGTIAALEFILVSFAFPLPSEDSPADFMIKEDWLKIMKKDPECYPCVSFSSLRVLDKKLSGTSASIEVEIRGHWTVAAECQSIRRNCFGFNPSKGVGQQIRKTMEYRKTANGWKLISCE